MKTDQEIEIKKIRKKLKIHNLSKEEKETLREKLKVLKILIKENQRNSVKNI